MSPVWIDALGIAAPGLADWTSAREVLSGRIDYAFSEPPRLKAKLLPTNEQRRLSPTIRIALAAAYDAMQTEAFEPECTASVFASSDGDMEVAHRICDALTLADRPVSPTQFHNSVHNAPAGYWAIATRSRMCSTSLSAFDHSFAAGLIEAYTMCVIEQWPVLLVAYDSPSPPPLLDLRPMSVSFAVALLLVPEPTPHSLARCVVSLGADGPETEMEDPALEDLRCGNPAGRSLPLLQRLCCRDSDSVALSYREDGCLRVDVEPCR